MKKIILSLFCFFVAHILFAQKGKPATGGGGGASPTSPASLPAASEPGYVYRLKYHYHIKYDQGDTVVSKYWQVKSKKIFSKHRLRVSVTQDTTRLKLGFYTTRFSILDTGAIATTPITNSNFPMLNTSELTLATNQMIAQYNSPTVSQKTKNELGLLRSYALESIKYKRIERKMRKIVKLDSIHFDPIWKKYYTAVNGKETFSDTAHPILGTDTATHFYLEIYQKDFLSKPIYFISLPYSGWDYGTLTVPFRYRFAPKNSYVAQSSGNAIPTTSESDATLNLSMYIGRKWGRTRFYADPTMTNNTVSVECMAFAGPSLIALSLSNIDSNTKKYIVATPGMNNKNTNTYIGPASMIALSTGGGIVLGYQKFSFGLFGGIDIPMTAHTGWVYDKKLWLGFGIGVNLGVISSGKGI